MERKIPRRIVLVAEDEALMRSLATEFLTDAGFTVLEAHDGEEALALLQTNHQINLLVSDVRMPRIDGYVLVRAALDLVPGLKVILMTGYATDVPNYIPQDKIRIFHKPFDFAELSILALHLTRGDDLIVGPLQT
jgi:CheY-like chemotaxis protein